MVAISRGTIPSLDGLRAVAVAIVIWGHAGLPGPLPGSIGVTIFYFLSGYLITTLLRREADRTGSISLRGFYLRRVLRIQPSLYVVLGLAVALSLAQVLPNRMTAWGAVSGATFWQNYYIIGAGRAGLPIGMNALWSLAVEEHFYLLFPVLYLLLRRLLPDRRQQAAVLALVCVAILVWRIVLVGQGAGYDRLYLASDTRADSILWGCVLALTWNPADMAAPRRTWPWSVAALAAGALFWAVALLPQPVVFTAGYTVQALLLGVVFVAVVRAPRSVPGRLLNLRPVAYVGVLSYSLYLVHRPILELLAAAVPSRPVALAAALAAMLVAALLLRFGVERPIERVRRRLRPAGGPSRPG